MIITDDGEHHVLQTSPATMTALTALARADTTLAWDPSNHTLIIANIIGTMPWTQQHGTPRRAVQQSVADDYTGPLDP
jgi:hypothetical protein